ncbi:MAG: hypothetical protein IJ593_07265 [Lachnospiraceae bacterium]|nr:hypothetical protein [Lachnospiraceae bacterium]
MITLDELNETIDSMFLSSQLESWNSLSNNDKQVVLNNAVAEFNKFMWIGRKADETQENAFPRIINNKKIETPVAVKLALANYCFYYNEYINNKDIDNMRNGITRAQIGDISETYDLDVASKQLSKFNKYLDGWIFRGVRGCC